jgi:hypothetical protein
MRTIVSLLLLFASAATIAQEREFPDYRSKKENFVRIQEKDIRSDLASFAIGGMDESIGKGKLKSIPPTNYGKNFISFSGNNIRVAITGGIFDESKHKLTYYNKEHLVKIDNKAYYGNYGEVPETVIQSVVVVMDKDTIPIPAAAYFDLYNPEFTYADATGNIKSYDGVYFSADKTTIYIYMLNRDKKGSYEVTWVIREKKYLRRVVDYGFLK